jgi:hypothetical protein
VAKAPRPTKVVVGSLTYSIKYKDSMYPYTEWCGLSAHDDLEIWILATQNELKQKETLCHEIDHCIYQVYGSGLDIATEEQHAHIRGFGNLGIIRSNPKVIAWLQS